ncbi:MAG: outer membrane beta-barrel protein [Rhizobiaceae bacterium]
MLLLDRQKLLASVLVSGMSIGGALAQETLPYIPGADTTANGAAVQTPQVIFDEPIESDSVQPSPRNRRAFSDNDPSGRNPRAQPSTQVGLIGPDGAVTPLANTRATPEQTGSPRSNDDPYAALGLRVGTFTLFPVLTQTIGTTSNADFSAGGSSAIFSQTDLRLRGTSNWSRHQLSGEIGGNYQTFFNDASDDIPAFNANLELRLDLVMDWAARFGVNTNITTESAVSDNISVPFPLFVIGRPQVTQMGGFAVIEKQAGLLNGNLRGTVTRTSYDSADISNGTQLSQDDRNNTLFELRGRVNYNSSALLQPFAVANLGFRRFDLTIDRNGNNRNSALYGLRVGLAYNGGEKLNGEISVGYANEVFDDNALNSLSGVTVDGVINWSPVRFTTITATAQTSFTGSTNVNESGSATYAASLGIVREVRPNLSLNGRILASLRSYDLGREDSTYQAQLGAEWRLNRNAALFGNVGYEVVESTDAGSSYNATTARVGIRLQK